MGVGSDAPTRFSEAGRSSVNLNDNGNIELGIVLLDVAGSILLPEFFHDRGDLFLVRDSNGLEFNRCAASVDANRRVLEHVLVPLRIGALHRHEVERVVFEHEPYRIAYLTSRLSSCHRDLDFAITRKAIFQVIAVSWHVYLR